MDGSFKLDAFREWVIHSGGIIDEPTSEWEALRYRLDGKTPRIVYIKKTGKVTITDEVRKDYRRFLNETGSGEQAIEKMRRGNSMPLKRRIAERDGDENGTVTCCYCGKSLTLECATLEHFLPISKGGPDHIENAALACEECNLAAGNMSVMEKILLRDRIRAAKGGAS